ncbi:hypothetical protein [Rhizobium sp. 9140]|uniref:hypothetical protein n=1 Tax=Rhizobium sp. 9140 TaxID=1761900 RepID=UPI00079A50CC|nr:hypothetical protein [Rhizobium sp. 9140]CZT37820.1 hypothetical protein GA0004734_00047140 [Rhizobium sp. 9140]
MAKDNSLLLEFRKLISQRVDAGQVAQPSEIVDEVLKSKPLSGVHAEFYRAYAKKPLVDMVTQMLKRVGMSDDPAPPQMVFPGHTRLVKSYPVRRNGERALVPLSQCSDRELSDHVSLLRKQAKGCDNHADELEGYVNNRPSSADGSQGKPNAALEPA